MQAEERDLIGGLFGRLRPFEAQPRDAEAERLIAEFVRRQPAAPYLLAQTVLVQEQALKAAQERIADLEGKAASRQNDSGFLNSAPRLGPWGARAPAGEPMPRSVQQVPAQGGGFLRSALATAAGVAGGALLFEGIRNLLSQGSGPLAAQAAQPSPLMPPDQMPASSDQYSPADVAQDGGGAGDYDLSADDSAGFDDGLDI